MATVTKQSESVIGDVRLVRFSFDFDSSYATGGEQLKAADLGLTRLDFLVASPTSGVFFEYDYSNEKLKAMFPTGGAGTPAAALATPKVATGATSASAVDATTPNLTPGVGKEVPASQNLSTLTGVRGFAIGV